MRDGVVKNGRGRAAAGTNGMLREEGGARLAPRRIPHERQRRLVTVGGVVAVARGLVPPANGMVDGRLPWHDGGPLKGWRLWVLGVTSLCPDAPIASMPSVRRVSSGEHLWMYYLQPRPGLAAIGVQPGTLLLQGQRIGNMLGTGGGAEQARRNASGRRRPSMDITFMMCSLIQLRDRRNVADVNPGHPRQHDRRRDWWRPSSISRTA